MLFVMPAWACESAVLATLPVPTSVTSEPTILRGAAQLGGVEMAGTRVSFRSAHGIASWSRVLDRPEDQDDWAPAEFGTTRVERLDAHTLFQQLDLSLFFGAVHIHRQVVVAIRWLARSPERLENCWVAADPAPWHDRLARWLTDAPFQEHGFGGWTLSALPDGGTAVSYSLWADVGAWPPSVQSWAMSRTLPDLMRAFEAYVGTPAADAAAP
jgi:hypothetical protein